MIIENKDCLDIIRERDGPDSLIYCDPPYFDAESLYAVDFPKEKHEELHHILSQCVGYAFLSIHLDGLSVLDFLSFVVSFYITEQQIFEWEDPT